MKYLNLRIILKGSPLRTVVGVTMLVLLLSGSAQASTLVVCPSGCTYSSIQVAINEATTGDTIQVQSGTYYENVNVDKRLILSGIGMPVVDARGNGNAITLAADGIILEGFTAVRAHNFGIYQYGRRYNTLSGNNANLNGETGIYLDSSSNNTLSGNNANSNNLYGIGLDLSSNNTLIWNNVNSNNAAGIFLYRGNNKIYNNIFNNTNNFYFSGSNIETWNITKQFGTNIIGGSNIGGNFWAQPDGNGYSQKCVDSEPDGLCDIPYELYPNNIDYLPLTYNPALPPAPVPELPTIAMLIVSIIVLMFLFQKRRNIQSK